MTAARATHVRWVWIFIDRPRSVFGAAARFWAGASGTLLSPRRGEHGEFATLVPARGDAYLKLQGVLEGGGAHLDFEVADLAAAADEALALGARVLLRERDGLTVLASPAGQPFCLTRWHGQSQWPPAVAVPGGARTRVDQVCLDLAPDAFTSESAFWSSFTGWDLRSAGSSEFVRLATPAHLPVRILIQRRDEPGQAAAHPDVACSDVAAVRAWHERLGARYVRQGRGWTVMRDPTGGLYCLTPRSPETGLVPAAAAR
jgi:catechol 2,3-dioxygenase-like lactoylglutathione lyase family enzyme